MKKRILVILVTHALININCYSMPSMFNKENTKNDKIFARFIALTNSITYFKLYLVMVNKWNPDSKAACAINTVLDEPFSSNSSIDCYKQKIKLLADYLRYNQHLISDAEYDKFFKNIIN